MHLRRWRPVLAATVFRTDPEPVHLQCYARRLTNVSTRMSLSLDAPRATVELGRLAYNRERSHSALDKSYAQAMRERATEFARAQLAPDHLLSLRPLPPIWCT